MTPWIIDAVLGVLCLALAVALRLQAARNDKLAEEWEVCRRQLDDVVEMVTTEPSVAARIGAVEARLGSRERIEREKLERRRRIHRLALVDKRRSEHVAEG